jgi:hypothetical protein
MQRTFGDICKFHPQLKQLMPNTTVDVGSRAITLCWSFSRTTQIFAGFSFRPSGRRIGRGQLEGRILRDYIEGQCDDVMADEEEADCEIVCEDVTGTIGSVAPFDNTTVPLDADSKGG